MLAVIGGCDRDRGRSRRRCARSRIIRTRRSPHCSCSWSYSRRRRPRASGCRLAISVAAMLVFNFFLLPPFHTLAIADPQNWVALFVFVVVAVIASQLSAAVRQRAREAEARRQEVTRLFDLSRDILLTTDSERAMADVARYVARRFELETVAICLPTTDGWQVHQGGERSVVPAREHLDRGPRAAPWPTGVRRPSAWYGGHVKLANRDRPGDPRSASTGDEARRDSGDPGRTAGSRNARCAWGRRGNRHRARAFSCRTQEGRDAQPAGRPGLCAPRFFQPRSADARHVRPRRGDEPSGCHAVAGGTAGAGRPGASRTGSADATVPRHPRHGARRRGGGQSRPAVGDSRRTSSTPRWRTRAGDCRQTTARSMRMARPRSRSIRV